MQLPAVVKKGEDGEASDGCLGQTPAGRALHSVADDGQSAKSLETGGDIRHVVREAVDATVLRFAPGKSNCPLLKHLRPRKSLRIIEIETKSILTLVRVELERLMEASEPVSA
ncbi:hypothetical protein M2323_003910 [Rhodoblastus acidophilus]|nr:hypothetical protein [Rhodoblastus acidophilus]MCW2286073.1 hypothetical protein [Rhodoblastus acidophilus]MCW2334967.1 hypothetical protein [Rhodoblastus acidophilus]